VELALRDLELRESVELIYEDSKCDGKEAASAINKLVSVDQVVAVIGELCSGATLAAAPVAEAGYVVMVSPASTAPTVSEAGEYIFRVIPSDALQGSFGAKLAYDKGYRKMGILYGNEDYGVGFNDVLKEEFPKLGGEVVSSEAFARGSTDLRTQITKLKAAEPDVVYIISNSPDSGVAALKQIKEQGLRAIIIGSEGLKGAEIVDGAKEAAEGLFITAVSGGSQEFMDEHQAEYGESPGPFSAQGYDAMVVIGEALKTGANSGESIRAALMEREFVGVTGMIKFDANGDVGGIYDVFKVENGEFVLQ
jgi:branched-chain amino acid transport system substrate-binding protein